MLNKPLAFVKQNQTAVIIIIGIIFLGYYFTQYSNDKNVIHDNMTVGANIGANAGHSANTTMDGPEGSQVVDDDHLDGAPIDFQVSNNGTNMTSCTKETIVNAAELLPKGSEWDVNMPQNVDISVLEPGNVIGSASQSMRNSNLQIRSEPANPQMDVGPWNQTTMAPDDTRRPLEIGCGSR